ncbi:hypothetical protein [Pantoea sp. FN0305]|uniref:hypothetical protein n=1 Tax=Pantoea sp. FN0305 TaxID=3418559 RepID=UPI003CEB66BA
MHSKIPELFMSRMISDWSPERIRSLLSWIEKRTPETVTLNANDFSSLMLYCEQLHSHDSSTLLLENEKLKKTIAAQARKIEQISQSPAKAKRLAVAIATIHSYADQALKSGRVKM